MRRAIFTLIGMSGVCLTAGAQEKVFFGNLHSHTSYSDGSGTPREAFKHAREEAKLDFLAVTEHNHSQAAGPDNVFLTPQLYKGPGAESLIPVANELTVDGQFVALYGQEVSTIGSGNHAMVFDIGEVVDTASVPNGAFDRLLDFLDAHPDSAGKTPVVMFNHPNNSPQVLPREYGRDDFNGLEDFVKKMGKPARLIQLINGPSQAGGSGNPIPSADEVAYQKFLNLGFRLAPTADQDNHRKNWGSSTEARTAIVAPSLTKANLLGAMRSRHVYATQDRNLSVVIKVNDRLCGDVIESLEPAGTALRIDYAISDADEPSADYEIQVFRDAVGGPFAGQVVSFSTAAGGGSGTFDEVALSGVPEFFYFKVTQFDEDGTEDHAWTAPVWFQNGPAESLTTPVGGVTPPVVAPPGGGPTTPIVPPPVAPPQPDPNRFVASRRSNTFHVSMDCLDAQRIKVTNRLFGGEATRGREAHPDCPRTVGAP